MNMNELVSWELIAGGAGAVTLTIIFTNLGKYIKWWDKMPTQIASYIISVILLELACVFTGSKFPSDYVLAMLNAGIVSLAANGGYVAYDKVKKIVKGV